MEFLGTHLTLDITGRSRIPIRHVVLIDKGFANAGTLHLQLDRSLRIEAVTHLLDSDGGTQHFDVVLTNDRQVRMEINETKLHAARHMTTTCGDLSPAIVFRLSPSDAGWILQGKKAPENGSPSLRISGQLESMGCGNRRLLFAVPLSFPLERDERSKVRLSLPTKYRSIALDLEKWDSVVFEFRLSDGTEFYSVWRPH
jgi:hypothetical protein